MANSWGHVARRLGADELAVVRAGSAYHRTCRAPKCEEPVTHATQYNYVTGRAGRTSWASRYVCTGHAEKFAARHGVEITEAATAREHAPAKVASTFTEQEG